MLQLHKASTREEITQRICEIVAEQMGMDAFQVKPCDSLDADLGIAGDDIDEIFAAVHHEFGTDFSDLSHYWEYHFYPEIAPMGTQVFLASSGVLISFLVPALFHGSLRAWAIFALFVVFVLVWQLWARRREKWCEAHKLPFTINDITDSVMQGKWEASEGIWDRIGRLGQKKRLS